MESSSKLLRLFLWVSILISGILLSCTLREPAIQQTSDPDINLIIDEISSIDHSVRANAVHQVGLYSDHPDKEIFLPFLVQALEEPDCGWECSRIRAFAAQSIRDLAIFDDRATKILLTWLVEPGHSEDEIIQAIYALDSFIVLGYEFGPVDNLISVLSESMELSPMDNQIRIEAANTLSRAQEKRAIPYLISIVIAAEEPSWVRREVAISLARFDQEARCAVPYLIPMLNEKESDLRISASIIINQASGSKFPDGQRSNWDSDSNGVWKFELQENGEYSIVDAALQWWQEEGQSVVWPECEVGINGDVILQPYY